MCTIVINTQLNGIELSFEAMPSETIRTAMKAAGFRWHRQKKIWYAKQTAERLGLAKKLSGGTDAPASPGRQSKPSARPDRMVSKYGLKAGDILTGSWGYSMTLVEIYKVTKIISPCRIEIVEIGADLQDADRSGGEYLIPNPEKIVGEPVIKNVMADRYSREENAFYVKINDCCNLHLYTGGTLYRNTFD